jgi:hypothetical protein
MGNLGWIAAFVYVAGAALRLARFNVMLDVADKRWFTGIPSPAAAALVAGFVWIIDDLSVDPVGHRWWAWAVTLFAGLTMVQQRPVLQLQDDQSQEERAVPRDLRVRPPDRAPGGRAGAGAVRGIRGLRAVGLRRLGMDVVRTPPPARANAAAAPD